MKFNHCWFWFFFFLFGLVLDTDGSNLGYVEDLDLSHIGVLTIPNSAFVYYTSLTRLNLANASIRSIEDTWFSSNNNILDWDLSHNEIVALRRAQFRHFKQLRLLNLMDNNIESIEQNSFQDLNQLTHLNLRYNRIRTLTPLGHMNRLQTLDLGENSINEVTKAFMQSSTILSFNLRICFMLFCK